MLSNPAMMRPQRQTKQAVVASAPVPAPVPETPVKFYVLEDWLTALVTFFISGVVFFYYMCPSVTLQDSGELVTGSYRFGVPHPSGYPLWAFLGWVWRHLVHYGDPASQLCSFSAFTGAAVVALMTIMAKRTTLIVLHAIQWREPLSPVVARLLALCTGIFVGLMFAFNRGVWLWSCVPEMRILSVFMFVLTAFLFLKWMLRPERLWLLLLTTYLYGLGIANHQTLTVMAAPFVAGAFALGLNRILVRQPLSLRLADIMPDLREMWALMSAALLVMGITFWIRIWLDTRPEVSLFSDEYVTMSVGAPVAGLILLGWFGAMRWLSWRLTLAITLVVMLGSAFYLYMPIAASTNPPMNWGFTATREGFLHHITRGQYQKLNFATPLNSDFWIQIFLFIRSLGSQYTYILAPLGLLTAVLFFRRWRQMTLQGRAVLLFVWAAFATTSLGLMMIINPNVDAQTWGIAIKFFAPAHGFYALLIGYALALMLAWLWSHNVPQRTLWLGLGCAAMLLAWSWPLRTNWALCEQRNHDFGYQFGFRMFYPGGDYPPMEKDAVLYGGTDPGRFVPTYMIFCESFAEKGSRYVSKFMEPDLTNKCATFDRRDVYIITQNALADGTYMNYIRDHYDFSRPNPDKPETIAKFMPWQQAIMRFAWKRMGRDLTYPKEPIFIPNPDEVNMAFRQFIEDVRAGRIQAGADIRIENGRVSVEGVGGVMAINGILAKWIFDKNKDKHAFYVEESYVISWMYPHLAPAGVIMKINKEPLPAPQQDPKLWQDIMQRDFTYWDKLLNNFVHREEFIRDVDAPKAFSKLRCAIAGLYEFRGIVNAAEVAYQQAISICPDSPEAAFRLANLYMRMNQTDKAIQTLQNLAQRDPFNKQVREALSQFEAIQSAMKPAR
ncbi:MAG: DUF2723 domain-containing protein [Verrucomicrobia bacterium]|nr:MAG: DUF2723 domain-containing protein [Verrucomicrobiota bacterium]